jgi:hypothetical protein
MDCHNSHEKDKANVSLVVMIIMVICGIADCVGPASGGGRVMRE